MDAHAPIAAAGKALHLTHWDKDYERSDTRKAASMSWYAKKTKLVGLGIGRVLEAPNNVAMYGVWSFIEIIASLAPPEHRGWLVRDGRPLSPEDMSALLFGKVRPEQFTEAIRFFLQPSIRWLELDNFPPRTPARPHRHPGEHRDATGKPPGDSPGHLPPKDGKGASAGEHRDATGQNSATDRQTDRQGTDRQTGTQEREREAAPRSGPPVFARESQLQWGALNRRKVDLEKLDGEGELTDGQAAELKKIRRDLRALEKKQRAGDFTPLAETASPNV